MDDDLTMATDGVIRLRPLGVDDLEAHVAGQDAAIIRWTNGGLVSTSERHLAWLDASGRAWRERSRSIDLGVETLTQAQLVGVVGLQTGLDLLEPGQVNLTYSLYPAHRGRGLASRAVRLAMGLARRLWAVEEFLIRCDPGNHRSAAVARRLGFAYVGCIAEPEGRLDRFVSR